MIQKSYNTKNLLFAAAFYLDKDVLHHNRSIYTFLDVLGDVGGLLDALKIISFFIVSLNF